MPRRTSVLVVVVLSLTISANAQESEPQPPQPQTTTNGSPADAQTPAGTDPHDQADAPPGVPPPGKPERVFGVLPNYGTVEDGATVSAITT
jgi:hypothetical protein